MQIVAVPLFDQSMAVVAYIFRYMKENNLFSTAQATNIYDGAMNSEALRMLDHAGLDAFTMGLPIFVPINPIMLMGRLQTQCKEPADKIIFVIEEPLPKDQLTSYIPIVKGLRTLGYRFAANYPYNFSERDEFMENCSYIFLSQRNERLEHTERVLDELKSKKLNIVPIAAHIYSEAVLSSLYSKGYGIYESRFYHVPEKEVDAAVSPLKTNAIRLINTVQNEDFDFQNVVSIIQGDPALTISLIQLVNSLLLSKNNKVKTISQAVTMLGQHEIRKWVTTAVSKSLGDYRPQEITRVSLIRAKFAENLAPMFKMPESSGELFLMGLFSILDVMLEIPIQKAIEMVHVSDDIAQAVVNNTGKFAGVMQMVVNYENARWSEVSRFLILEDITEEELSKAYIEAIVWFGNLTRLEKGLDAETDSDNTDNSEGDAVQGET